MRGARRLRVVANERALHFCGGVRDGHASALRVASWRRHGWGLLCRAGLCAGRPGSMVTSQMLWSAAMGSRMRAVAQAAVHQTPRSECLACALPHPGQVMSWGWSPTLSCAAGADAEKDGARLKVMSWSGWGVVTAFSLLSV